MDDDTSSSIEIAFICKDCGETEIELPDDYTEDSIAICTICKAPLGSFSDVKSEAIKAAGARAIDDMERPLREGFRGIKNVTFKSK